MHQLKNCVDLLVGYRGTLYLFEVKDGAKPESARQLTEGEAEFFEDWKDYPVHVVTSLDDCLKIFQKK